MDRPQALLRFAPPWKSDREVLIGTQRQDHEKNAAATRVASLVRSAQAAGSRNLMRSRFCMLIENMVPSLVQRPKSLSNFILCARLSQGTSLWRCEFARFASSLTKVVGLQIWPLATLQSWRRPVSSPRLSLASTREPREEDSYHCDEDMGDNQNAMLPWALIIWCEHRCIHSRTAAR